MQQEEVFFDPVIENDVANNLAPTQNIAMHEDSDNEERPSDHRTSSEVRNGVTAKITAARKFDIKQLKAEIWKILEPKIPAYFRDSPIGTQDFRIYLQKDKPPLSFMQLVKLLSSTVENTELLENLSIHQTFLCILHLANEYSLRLVSKNT